MKPFTIRKQAQPARVGSGAADNSMEASHMSNKYNTNPTSPGVSPLASGRNMGMGLMPSVDQYDSV